MKTKKNVKKKTSNKNKSNKHKSNKHKSNKHKSNKHNLNTTKYDPLFVIIEPTDISKRIMNFTLLRKILKSYGLKECNQFECYNKKPMFIWLNYDENSMYGLKRKYYNTQVFLQNSLTNIESVSSKDKLHLGMKEKFPEIYEKHLAHSLLLTKAWKPKLNQVYIARPINVLQEKKEKGTIGVGYGGKDIVVIHDHKTLEDAKKNLEKYDNVLISEYIINPLLFKKKKFHIRTYLLASIINNEYNSYMLDFGHIYTAKEEYKNSDFSNPNIHDTHFKCTDNDYFFPKDFNNENLGVDNITNKTIDNILQQIRNCFKAVAKLLSENVSNYDNIKNGFNTFGVDLIIEIKNNADDAGNAGNNNKYNVILIEVNDSGGYRTKTNNARNILDSALFNWFNNTILTSIFKNKKENELYQSKNKFLLFNKKL